MAMPSLLTNLTAQQPKFLNHLRPKVHSHINRTGKKCFSIIQNDPNSDNPRTHHLGDQTYMPVLWCFLRNQPYHDHQLNSALTDPVARIIAECYTEFLRDNSAMIAQYCVQKMVGDDRMLEVVFGEALDREVEDKEGMAAIRRKAVNVMVESVKHAQAASTQAVSSYISAGISEAADTGTAAFAQKLGPSLLKALTTHSQTAVTHILSSAEFTTTIYAAARNCTHTVLLMVFLHVFSSKLDTVGSRTAVKLLTGVPSFHVIRTLAGGLAEQISESVDKEFGRMNEMAVESVAVEMSRARFRDVVDDIARSGAVEEVVKHFGGGLGERRGGSKCLTRARSRL